jgi:hypothetical protein
MIFREAGDKVNYQLTVMQVHQKIDEFLAKVCKNKRVSIVSTERSLS